MPDGRTYVTRIRNPQDPSSHIYLADGGVEGQVLVLDAHMTPLSLVAFCMSWELEGEPNKITDHTLEFNMR